MIRHERPWSLYLLFSLPPPPPADYRGRDWVGFVRFLRCLFSLCIILYRTQCDTTCLSTNVSCESKTWKGRYGRWTKWSFTRDGRSALAARPGTLPLPMLHRSEKKYNYNRAFYSLYSLSFYLSYTNISYHLWRPTDWNPPLFPSPEISEELFLSDHKFPYDFTISQHLPFIYIYIYVSLSLSLFLPFYIYLYIYIILTYSLLLFSYL